jgi:hypothetical protein
MILHLILKFRRDTGGMYYTLESILTPRRPKKAEDWQKAQKYRGGRWQSSLKPQTDGATGVLASILRRGRRGIIEIAKLADIMKVG